MGLDDLSEDAKESAEQDRVEEMKDKLGVESMEDLDQMENRIQNLAESSMSADKQIEALVDEVTVLKGAVAELIRRVNELEDEESDTVETNDNSEESPSWTT